MATKKIGELKGLTALRGLAAFYVVLLHFSTTAQSFATANIPSLAPSGVLAVDLFFMLSGFIMAYSYLGDFDAHGIKFFPTFLFRRIARIAPLNIALLLILSAAAVLTTVIFGHSPFPEIQLDNVKHDLLPNLLLLQGVGIGHNMNGPSWSISDEVIAYLTFPLLLALVFHRGTRVCVAAALIAAAVLLAMASFQPHLGMDPVNLGLFANIPRCLGEFLLGLVAFRFYNSPQYQQYFASDWALGTIVLAIGVIVLFKLGEYFAVMLFPLLIVASARNRGVGQRFLEHRFPYFMGLISYSLYLIHDPIRPLELILVKALHPQSLSIGEAVAFTMLGSLSIIGPAWLTFHYIEGPGRRGFRRFFHRFGAKQAPIAVTTE